jgi:hypothetical protein
MLVLGSGGHDGRERRRIFAAADEIIVEEAGGVNKLS